MATEKLTREVVSTSNQEASKATFNGWNLNFVTSKVGSTVKSINVNGTKDNKNVVASFNETGAISVTFMNGDVDNLLATTLFDEMKAIKLE
ncbi:Uncharacterised protein [Sphingobacterium spiritivorum]|uniref:Uncharacterized protein n=1 Tax=Sphingobacterium spiritivorum TaxID=258 RepID=A0A380CQF4_SPHSI|nr:hypothetical protein [Sphingobacterium spiritivorum]SUJ26585.1 Uncharacterised protein [Sphingobacterium spiritivorum]